MRWAAVETWVRGLVEAVEPEQPGRRITLPDAQARTPQRRGALDREARIELRGGQPSKTIRNDGPIEIQMDVQAYVFVRLPRLKGKVGNPTANAQVASDAARVMRRLHKSEVIGAGDDAQAVTVQAYDWALVTEPDNIPAVRITARIRYQEAAEP